MKRIIILFSLLLLNDCSTDEISPDDCYGLDSPACIKAGYRADQIMHPTQTIYKLSHPNSK